MYQAPNTIGEDIKDSAIDNEPLLQLSLPLHSEEDQQKISQLTQEVEDGVGKVTELEDILGQMREEYEKVISVKITFRRVRYPLSFIEI